MLWQLCNDTSDPVLIENNGVTSECGCNSILVWLHCFQSDKHLRSIVTVLTLTLSVNEPQSVSQVKQHKKLDNNLGHHICRKRFQNWVYKTIFKNTKRSPIKYSLYGANIFGNKFCKHVASVCVCTTCKAIPPVIHTPILTPSLYLHTPISTPPLYLHTPISTPPLYLPTPISTPPLYLLTPSTTPSLYPPTPISTTPPSQPHPSTSTPPSQPHPSSFTPHLNPTPITTPSLYLHTHPQPVVYIQHSEF